MQPDFLPGRVYSGFTNNPTRFFNGDGTQFNVRVGPDYKRHGKKAPSAFHVYEPVSMDLFRGPKARMHLAKTMNLHGKCA